MDMFEAFLQNNDLNDPDDIGSLLELASLTRRLIVGNLYPEINDIINYTVKHEHYEAFSWVIGILQEEFEKEECALNDFECSIGKSVPDYDEFVKRLQVRFDTLKNDYETVTDENGEVQSFFNIFTYRTGFRNVFLVSSENFDTKDNDYIQYKLLFARNTVK